MNDIDEVHGVLCSQVKLLSIFQRIVEGEQGKKEQDQRRIFNEPGGFMPPLAHTQENYYGLKSRYSKSLYYIMCWLLYSN